MSINYKLGVVAVLALLASGSVFAKTYGVWLKKGVNDPYVNSAGLKCATGTVDSVSKIFNMTIKAGCFVSGINPQPAIDVTITGTATVGTTDIVITTGNPPVIQQPVTSADGVTFTGSGLELKWSSTAPGIRTFEFKDGTTLVAQGSYHLFTPDNLGNPVPEPETLALALIGLASLALTRRKRK